MKKTRPQPVRPQAYSSPQGMVETVALPHSAAHTSPGVLRPLQLRERYQAIPTDPNSTYLDLECLADIMPEPLDPVWGSVIARGAVTVLAGEPGVGKSCVAIDIAAAVTRGELGPRSGLAGDAGTSSIANPVDQQPGQPQGVLICSPHYERASILRRRLEAADADLSLVQTIHGVRQVEDFGRQGPCWSFQMDRDLAIFEQELTLLQGDETDIALVVFDPFPLGLCGSGAKQARQLQELTSRLAEIAYLCQVAILLVCDALPLEDSKRATSITPYSAVERVAQSIWVVERDPQSSHRRLLLPAKVFDEADVPGLAFEWRDGAIDWDQEAAPMTAREFRELALQRARNPLMQEDASELGRAMDWLQMRLADGPVQSRLVKQEAGDNEISYATLRRAFCALRIESTRIENSRHHTWAVADRFHARRVTGLEGGELSLDEGGLRSEGVEVDRARQEPVRPAVTGVDQSLAEEGAAVQVCVHDEHELEHQLEHALQTVKQGVSNGFVIDAQGFVIDAQSVRRKNEESELGQELIASKS